MTTRADLLARAHALGPRIRAEAAQLERERQVSVEVFAALTEADLTRLYLPRALGGLEVDPVTFIQVVEEVARHDGSVGWCLAVWGTYGVFGGYLRPEIAAEIYRNDPSITLAGTLNPTGKAVSVDGGYQVSGRWGFGSGIQRSTWTIGNCVVYHGDQRGVGADGGPEMRIAIVPTASCQIHDTWHVGGLRGTGSHDYSIADVFVPEERTMIAFTHRPYQNGPLYACPFGAIFSAAIAAPALGIARGAIEALVELAGAKVPTGSQSLLRDKPGVQTDLARAEALLRSARSFLFETVDDVWNAASRGEDVPFHQRALVRIACTNAAQSAAQAVDLTRNAAGATALYESSPLERAFRDVHAATQHLAVTPTYYELAGRVLLGLDPGTSRF